MATAAELLDAVEALVDELEGDLGLAAGVNLPREPLPTIKQMMVALEPRLRAIALAVPPLGSVGVPEIDLQPVLSRLALLDDAAARIENGNREILAKIAGPPPAPNLTESADRTESPPAPNIVDANGMVWEVIPAADLLVYYGREIYARAGAAWTRWIGAGWVSSADPRVAAPPPPAPNRDPVWPAGEMRLDFISGQAKVIRLADFPSDPDGDALRLSFKAGTLAPGFVYDEPSDELRYDGRSLPAGNYGVFTVAADDGRG